MTPEHQMYLYLGTTLMVIGALLVGWSTRGILTKRRETQARAEGWDKGWSEGYTAGKVVGARMAEQPRDAKGRFVKPLPLLGLKATIGGPGAIGMPGPPPLPGYPGPTNPNYV